MKKSVKIFCLIAVLLGALMACACGAVENQADDVVVCVDEDGNYYAVSADGKTFLFYYPGNASESFCVPDGIETVADDAFRWADGLKELTFSSDVKTIGNIFYENIALEKVVIPALVESYKNKTFEIHSSTLKELVIECEIGGLHVGGCCNLKSITLANAPKAFGDLMFDGCTKLISIKMSGEGTIRDEEFEAYCAERNGYPVLYIPNGAESLGNELINSCVNLYVPDSVKTVDYVVYAYLACDGGIVSMPEGAEIRNAPSDAEAELYSVSEVVRRK